MTTRGIFFILTRQRPHMRALLLQALTRMDACGLVCIIRFNTVDLGVTPSGA